MPIPAQEASGFPQFRIARVNLECPNNISALDNRLEVYFDQARYTTDGDDGEFVPGTMRPGITKKVDEIFDNIKDLVIPGGSGVAAMTVAQLAATIKRAVYEIYAARAAQPEGPLT